MVKPLFLSEIKNKEGNTKKYLPQVLNSKIASPKTISTLQFLLTKKINGAENEIITENNVKVAGSAATISLNYAEAEIKEKRYLSSFVGYFPANKPKYSILCFIYNPKVNVPVYSSLVSGKVIKSIIEKIK
jgi:cell division protein FtsI (penicillin-binding protein 3)